MNATVEQVKRCDSSENFYLGSQVETAEQKRKGVMVSLNAEAREVVERLREDTGIPNTEALTRILEWFASRDRKFRLALLNGDEDTKAGLARLTLLEMAGLDGADEAAARPFESMTFEQAQAVANAALLRMSQIHKALQNTLDVRVADDKRQKKGK